MISFYTDYKVKTLFTVIGLWKNNQKKTPTLICVTHKFRFSVKPVSLTSSHLYI